MKPTVLLFLWLVTVNLVQAAPPKKSGDGDYDAPAKKKSGDGDYDDNYGQRKYLVIKLHDVLKNYGYAGDYGEVIVGGGIHNTGIDNSGFLSAGGGIYGGYLNNRGQGVVITTNMQGVRVWQGPCTKLKVYGNMYGGTLTNIGHNRCQL